MSGKELNANSTILTQSLIRPWHMSYSKRVLQLHVKSSYQIAAFVFAGLPTTRTRIVFLATLSMAVPWTLKRKKWRLNPIHLGAMCKWRHTKVIISDPLHHNWPERRLSNVFQIKYNLSGRNFELYSKFFHLSIFTLIILKTYFS